MSIPKEPRQLMINVMYLVLTALLALNVSAEIFNAFDMVDNGLKTANTALDASNDKLPQLIKDGAKKKDELAVYAERVDVARDLSKNSTTYISEMVDRLIDEGGDINGAHDDGDYVVLKNGLRELRGKKNYDATTRLMVDDGAGEELKERMLEIKNEFLALVDEDDRADFSLPIDIDDELWKKSLNKKHNWADFTFGHMPIGATLPIFTKFQNDIKSSEAAVLNYLAGKVGTTTDVVLDKFKVVSSAKKSYVIKGEQYEADIFLSAAADAGTKTGISISVGGSPLRTDAEGVAKFTANASSLGVKTYKADITVTNPVTGEKQTYSNNFEYEVGERSLSIAATKMNVFYRGVDNPIEISAGGVPSNQIKVSMTGGTVTKKPDGTYNVVVGAGREAKITVSAPGMTSSKDFRIKRIPDPVAKLGKIRGGAVGDGAFKVYPGVIPVLENFDFDAKCNVTDFLLIRQPRRLDPEFSPNKGGRYTAKSKGIVNKATSGDNYIFQNIKCKCPGDNAARDIGTMVFTIK